jgi:hypothetical protein
MKKNECWIGLDGKCLNTQPEGYYGFVYKITNLSNGRIYIGKKGFVYRKRKTIPKKKRVDRKRTKVEVIDSQWLKYYGSSEELKADLKALGPSKFKREILHLCKNKAQLNYLELVEQINHKVLENDSYNKWIYGRIFKNKNLLE